MISGVTLLYKEDDYKTFFRKRLFKQFLIIVLFGTLQYFRYVRTGKVILSLHSWIYAMYSKPVIETYWYLYLYLGFLLVLPVLQQLVPLMACGLFGLTRQTVKQKETSAVYTLITAIGSTVFCVV